MPAVRLDDVLDDAHVDLLKLDTQGTEHVVLEGARRTLGRCHPALLCEFWPHGIRQLGDDPATVLGSYVRLGYGLEVLEDPSLSSVADHRQLVEAIDARPDPVGGFVTLVLRPG